MKLGAKKPSAKKHVPLYSKGYDRNHTDAILEDINGKFDVLVEGQQSLSSRMDGLENEFTDFKQEMTEFKQESLIFQQETKSSLQTIFDYLSRIDDELKEIRSEIKGIRRDLLSKAEVARVERLEKRVVMLERELATKI